MQKDYDLFEVTVGAMTVIIAIVVLLLCSTKIVDSGSVGIKIRMGAVQEQYIGEGLNFHFPFIEKIVEIDCKTQKADIEGEAASKDLQTVTTSIAVNYRVDAEQAFNLYKTIGKNYETIVITPAIQESMKTTIAQYNAEELVSLRAEVAAKLEETLISKLADRGIVIESISIVNLNFSTVYNQAIESKQVAEQEAKKAKQELEKAKVEAEKKIVEAQAEAEALRAQKEAITDDLLELRKIENEAKMIEKWNGVLPNTMLTDGMPMFNISK